MANLKTNFLGVELKNPVGVTSCEFGGHSWLAKRVCEQNIGWLIAILAAAMIIPLVLRMFKKMRMEVEAYERNKVQK